MANEVLHELSKLNIVVSKQEEATIAWYGPYLTILSEKGLHIFEISHNLQCWDKKINFTQSLINHPKSSPATCLFTDKIVNKYLRNIDQTEMIIDHALWPHNTQLLQEMSVIVDFQWMPADVVSNNEPAVAVLTNVGVVEIYKQHLFDWYRAFEISTILSQVSNVNSFRPHSFTQAKDMTYMLATCAMSWAPTLNEDNSCYFVTAQKNGNIIFWLIECNGTAKTMGTLKHEFCELQFMLWIPVDIEKFMLICSNILGQIMIFSCCIQSDSIVLQQSFIIWSDKDKMVPKFMEYIQVDKNLVLVCNKHRHLLVLMVNQDCNKLGHYINNINDYRITSICKSKGDIYVTTVNGLIYKLNMVMENKELNMILDIIQHPGLSPTHELYGIAYSPNKVLCAISIADRKINSRKEPIKIEIVLMSSIENLVQLTDILLLNPSKQLTDYWDVIEILRYKCLKTKELPGIHYNQLYEMAVSDIYMLKVYYVLCILCDNLKRTFKILPAFQLPENCPDTVKEEILVAHAEKKLYDYSKKFQEQGKLNQCDVSYYIGAKKFLEYYCNKNKKNLNEVLNSTILSIFETNSFICQCCDEEVTGFQCKNNHLNMFCALTFTPIHSDDYLVCKWCNLTAKLELLMEKPLCLFCDNPLTPVEQHV